MQLFEPAARQDAQDLSHVTQVEDAVSKNAVDGQTGTQRPFCSTGLDGGHVRHLSAPGEEQVAQSGWQSWQVPFPAMVFDGQSETQVPMYARPVAHEVQWLLVPAQVLQEISHAGVS